MRHAFSFILAVLTGPFLLPGFLFEIAATGFRWGRESGQRFLNHMAKKALDGQIEE